jgi:6-phosphogluconolactonase
MTRKRMLWVLPIAAVLLFLASSTAVAAAAQNSDSGGGHGIQGAVFTATNAPAGNAVLAYKIAQDGSFTPAGDFSTGGTGTGASLADSGSLVLTSDHGWLLVVNAGSSTVSVFQVNSNLYYGSLLKLTDQVSSFGTLPVSITVSGSFVYVLNAGTSSIPGNIFGYRLAHDGQLTPLIGSSQPLSTSASTAPAQISFNPAGNVLVVTEKNTSVLDTYTVDHHGFASGPTVTPSGGATPYGFAWARDATLVVSDAGPGALSTYSVAPSGVVTVVNPADVDGQAAPCWVATVDGGQIAYTSNAHSGTISTYDVNRQGALTLVTAISATTGAGDTDLAVGGWGSHYLFVSDVGTPEIQEFSIGWNGSLTIHNAVVGLPATSEGLAAF